LTEVLLGVYSINRMQLVAITTKGQVTIPIRIRKKLGLGPGDKVIFEEEAGSARVRAVPDFFSFRGALKGKKLPTPREIEKIAADEAVRRYLKTFK